MGSTAWVRRLMRVMGIEALVPRPARAKPRPAPEYYPYLLRGRTLSSRHHVWAADVTFIPMACGFLYLVVIIDSAAERFWRGGCRTPTIELSAQRRWRKHSFGSDAADFNTDQGSTSPPRLSPASSRRPQSRFRWTERQLHEQRFHRTAGALDRSEEVHLKAYADAREARAGIDSWMTFYNFRRPHQAMNNQVPMAVWRAGMDEIEAAARAVDMPLRFYNANALPTYPQPKRQEAA